MSDKLKVYAEGGVFYIDSDISGWECILKHADFIAIPLQKGDEFPGYIPNKVNRYKSQEVWEFREELFGIVNGRLTIVYHLGTGQMIAASQNKEGALAIAGNRLSEFEDFQKLYDQFKPQLKTEHITELQKCNDKSNFIKDSLNSKRISL